MQSEHIRVGLMQNGRRSAQLGTPFGFGKENLNSFNCVLGILDLLSHYKPRFFVFGLFVEPAQRFVVLLSNMNFHANFWLHLSADFIFPPTIVDSFQPGTRADCIYSGEL